MHAAPPLKRQRVSTPHRTSSFLKALPQSPVDVQRERDASKLRLLDVWSSLADRYTRRLDEDDIVDIRTGKITTDRGFIRNSRKIDFGAIAAPAAGDVIADDGTDEDEEEEEEGEYDTDELDAFAHTTSEAHNADQSGMPPAFGSADAEDLRAFLEAERRRKDLCGSEVEEDSTALCSADAGDLREFLEEERRRKDHCGSEVEEEDESASDTSETYADSRTALDSASEDELDNWDVDESSIVYPVLKQGDNDSDIEIIEGPTQSILQMPPSLNKSISTSNARTPSIKPYVLLTPRESISPAKSKKEKQNFTPKSSISGSGSESDLPYHYPYRHSRHRKEQHHPRLPADMVVPPIPDPRAQFIITQAMQQLSALVGTPWTPPHDSFIPHTPSRRHHFRQANSTFNTPTYHPHPYPYSYNPNLSLATLPPESPKPASSPEKSLRGPRKSSMARSHSRGRRVSFKIDDDESGDSRGRVDVCSSPSKPPLRREVVGEQGRRNFAKQSNGKGKARAETLDSESSSEDPLNCGSDGDRKTYLRGRTPGPKLGPPRSKKLGQDKLKGRLKGVPEVVA